MSEAQTRDKNARDYWKLMEESRKKDELSLLELSRLNSLPDSELMKIPRVAEIQGALTDSVAKYESVAQDSALAEGFDRQYSLYVRSLQRLGIGVDMMSKQIVNTAFIKGRSIEGAHKIMSRREPVSLLVQVAFVLMGIITIAIAGSIFNQTGVGTFLLSAPYFVPNWLLLGGVFAITVLYLRGRGRRQA